MVSDFEVYRYGLRRVGQCVDVSAPIERTLHNCLDVFSCSLRNLLYWRKLSCRKLLHDSVVKFDDVVEHGFNSFEGLLALS